MIFEEADQEDFDELIKRKYNINHEQLMSMDYKQRNQKLYDMLKMYQICVIPD